MPQANTTKYTELVPSAVREHMALRSVTQTQLAHAVGMSQPAINRRLMGRVPFTIGELSCIAHYLDVPLTTLLGHPERGTPAA